LVGKGEVKGSEAGGIREEERGVPSYFPEVNVAIHRKVINK
jgi:hypothetical protein